MLNVAEEELSNLESVTRLEYDPELDKEAKLLSGILASNADQNWK